MSAEGEATVTTDEIPEWKRREVDDIAALLEDASAVGVVNVTGIPSRQLQEMRATLHGRGDLRMGRNTLIRRALERVDEGIETLVDDVEGQVGLVVSDANPFTLYRTLEDTKTAAPINAGETAPNDIVIEAGDTGMDPGPFVGELQQVGANARIQDGSIHVLSDSTVAEAGEVVSDRLANVLGELGIEPKEVGLDLKAVYADGVRFDADELAIDIDAYRSDVEAAVGRGRGLSVGIAYPTAATAAQIVGTAARNAHGVGIAGAIESDSLADDLVAQADAHIRALASHIDDEEALPEELRAAAPAPVEEPAEPEEPEETPEEETETDDDSVEPDEDEADDDDMDEAGAGLGDMFG